MYQLLVQRESWSFIRHLGSCSVDSAFDDRWKEEVYGKVSESFSISHDCVTVA